MNYLKKLLLLTLVLACVLGLASTAQHKYVISSLSWMALGYYFLLSLATGLIVQSAMNKETKIFLSRAYSAMGIRFVFSIFPVLIYLLFSPSREVSFLVIYILLYFLYTSFEIYTLVVNLRPDLKK